MQEIYSTYLHPVLSVGARKSIINFVTNSLNSIKDYDVILVSGASGLLVGPIVSHLLEKPIGIIRKNQDKEPRHSWREYEGLEHYWKYVVVDDLIDSGETLKRIVDVAHYRNPNSVCAGLVMYNQSRFGNSSIENGVLGEIFPNQQFIPTFLK